MAARCSVEGGGFDDDSCGTSRSNPVTSSRVTPAAISILMARVTLALALVLLAACGGVDRGGDTSERPRSDDQRVVELDERRARWEEQRPTAYLFTVAAQCFCLDTFSTPRTVTVQDGQAVSEDPAPDQTTAPERIRTVDDLFDRARAAIDDAEAVEIEYDNEFDFPAAIDIDHLIEAIDDEVTYVVTDFEVVSV
jgi:Family of unknown function (DUF6174)